MPVLSATFGLRPDDVDGLSMIEGLHYVVHLRAHYVRLGAHEAADRCARNSRRLTAGIVEWTMPGAAEESGRGT